MSQEIPEKYVDLLQKPAFGNLGTLMKDANPYRYLEIRGKVVEITETGADDHINKLSQKYLGNPVYPFRQPGEVRVTYKIEPEKVNSMG